MHALGALSAVDLGLDERILVDLAVGGVRVAPRVQPDVGGCRLADFEVSRVVAVKGIAGYAARPVVGVEAAPAHEGEDRAEGGETS